MLFSRPSDAALSSPTAPSPLSSLRLFVVASGPTTIFKTVCRSVAPMRASGACTELRMGQLHGWPTGMSNLAGRTSQRWFHPRLGPPAFPVSGTGIATHLAVPAQTRGSSLIPRVQSTARRGVSAFGHILPPPGPVSGRPRPGASAISHLVSSRRAARQSPCLVSPQNPPSMHQLGHSSANQSAALPGGFLLDLNRAQLSMAPGSHTLWSVPLRPQLFQLPVYS